MINWEAIGAEAEIVGATDVIIGVPPASSGFAAAHPFDL